MLRTLTFWALAILAGALYGMPAVVVGFVVIVLLQLAIWACERKAQQLRDELEQEQEREHARERMRRLYPTFDAHKN